MKRLSLLTLALAATLASFSAPSMAQGLTREQVKMERDAFLALMRWDELTGMNWRRRHPGSIRPPPPALFSPPGWSGC